MDGMEKRRHTRIDSLNLSYVCANEKGEAVDQGMGRTLNVSASGILLETYFPIALECSLELTIALEDDLVDIKGRVAHIRKRGEGKSETGIEFFDMTEESIRILDKFIRFFNETQPVFETDFPKLNLMKRGKVRDMYDVGDALLMVATDRLSAYDVVMPDPIPDKGKVLTQLSLFWFDVMKTLIQNHLITADVNAYPEACKQYEDTLKGRSMLIRKTEPLPVECVVRGYLSGSGWKSYQESGTVCGIELPKGLKESDKLPEPIFTPSTKEEVGVHDINIDFEEMSRRIGPSLAEKVKSLSLALYQKGAEIADKQGIIIADTKFEFGLMGDELLLIDEVLTPDSSRFWPKETYAPGGPQKSFDKQYVRDYLTSIHWDKTPPAPALPEEVIENTREKYLEALRQLSVISEQ